MLVPRTIRVKQLPAGLPPTGSVFRCNGRGRFVRVHASLTFLWAMLAVVTAMFASNGTFGVGLVYFFIFCFVCELIVWQIWILLSKHGICERLIGAGGGAFGLGLILGAPIGIAMLPLRMTVRVYKYRRKYVHREQFQILDVVRVTFCIAVLLAAVSWLQKGIDAKPIGELIGTQIVLAIIATVLIVAAVAAQCAWLIFCGSGEMMRWMPTLVLLSIFLANASKVEAMWNRDAVVLLGVLMIGETTYLAISLWPLRLAGIRLRLGWK